MGGRRRVRRRHRAVIDGLAGLALHLRRVDQAVTAHPETVVGLRQAGDQVAALIVGDDHLGVARRQVLVSAITHTPASGPFGPVTTPPISVEPMFTPGRSALLGAQSRRRLPADRPARSPRRSSTSLLLVLILRFSLPFSHGARARLQSKEEEAQPPGRRCPLSSHSPWASATASRIWEGVIPGRQGLRSLEQATPALVISAGESRRRSTRRCAITAWNTSRRDRRRSATADLDPLRRVDHPRFQSRRRPERGGVPAAKHRARLPTRCRVRQHLHATGREIVPARVARFRQVDRHEPRVHHDALEFPDGKVVLVTRLVEGQHVTVLQGCRRPRRAPRRRKRLRRAAG